MEFTAEQKELIQQIILFGQRTGFDFQNISKLSLDKLMLDWLKDCKDFASKVKSTDLETLKLMFNI